MIAFLSQWGHAAAAVMFAALALWFLPRVRHGQVAWSMVSACGLTAIWALVTAANGPETVWAMGAEVLRNLGWLALMYAFWRRDAASTEMRTVVALYGALLLVAFLQIVATLVGPGPGASATNLATYSDIVLGMLFSVGGLVLVHNLYTAGTSDTRIQGATARTTEFFERTGRIVELDAVRLMNDQMDEEGAAIPEWLMGEPSAWVVVPLLHFGKLNALAVLGRPAMARTLDWEDFDLLKVVGRQVATYLAEANGQHALATAQRFDEFNRRFAFIMHDVKNLVSQLTLVARNAEKHAGNPDFQADMIATLKSSVARMNDLLARLSQHNKAQAEQPRAIPLAPLVARVAAAKRYQMPVVTSGETDLYLIADPARLEHPGRHAHCLCHAPEFGCDDGRRHLSRRSLLPPGGNRRADSIAGRSRWGCWTARTAFCDQICSGHEPQCEGPCPRRAGRGGSLDLAGQRPGA